MGRSNSPAEEMAPHGAAWLAPRGALERALQRKSTSRATTPGVGRRTDYPDFNIPLVNQMFKDWKGHKKADIMGYRNLGFPRR
ncbi:MAG: hypothetical protein Ct9H300mP12_13390 [Acidimicrobiales bacterium]|nr:MAG: hypothetical protein Ct9H300mP12_13390 [Acidimicrobiales bacterium]